MRRIFQALIAYVKMNKAKKDLLEKEPLLEQAIELSEIKENDDALLKQYQVVRALALQLCHSKQKYYDKRYNKNQQQLWFDHQIKSRPFYQVQRQGNFVEYAEYEQAATALLDSEKMYEEKYSQVSTAYLQDRAKVLEQYEATLTKASKICVESARESVSDILPQEESEEDGVVLRMRMKVS